METPGTSFISIDFWNTIVNAHTNGEKRAKRRIEALHKLAESFGKNISATDVKQAHAHASARFDEIWLGQARTPNSYELVGFTLESLKLSVSAQQQRELAFVYEESLLDGPPELAPGVLEAVEKLAAHYKLGIISDTMFSPGRVLKAFLDDKGLGRHFSAFAFSDEVGVSKPHPKMFEKILTETGSSTQGSWHIGDIQQTDIKGAQGFGIKGILYTGVSDFHKKDTTADLICESWEQVCDAVINP
ncbi:MAG: HAD family hydrolase [Balneolales bacterium]|nr:HAD family hydrolase [Balneolales bacterium]